MVPLDPDQVARPTAEFPYGLAVDDMNTFKARNGLDQTIPDSFVQEVRGEALSKPGEPTGLPIPQFDLVGSRAVDSVDEGVNKRFAEVGDHLITVGLLA